jgi:hypothetical protein
VTKGLLLAALIFPQVSAAQATTVGDFLTWEKQAQASFIQISMSMLVTVAAQQNGPVAKCLDDWYFVDGGRTEEIISVMVNYQDFGPSAFILGYAESHCGQIKP